MILYVAPHLDDVPLSCSARILADLREGKKAVIATVFTEGDGEHSELYALRKGEERTACGILGADFHFCNLMDAPFRSQKFSSFAKILWGEIDDENDPVSKASDCIVSLLSRNNISLICAPLGAGWHVDHIITHKAAVRSAKAGGMPIEFYEDRPYVFVQNAVKTRLDEFRKISPSSQSIEEMLSSLSTAPWFQSIESDAREKSALVDALINRFRNSPDQALDQVALSDSRLYHVDSPQIVWNILDSYASQLPALYPSREYFVQRTLEYSKDVLGADGYAERYWRC